MTSSPGDQDRLHIVFIQRKPNDVQLSIERLFDVVRSHLSSAVGWTVHVSPSLSRGVLPRLRNLAAARKAVGSRIAHITGDIHYLAFALAPRSFVLTIHDCAVLDRLHGWRREIVRRLWFEWPIRRAGAVTAISQTTRNELKKWVSAELHSRIRVIPNCIPAAFRRDPLDFKASCPTFLQIGTKYPKNLEMVASALSGIPCRLEIVGTLSSQQRALLSATGIAYVELGRVSDDRLYDAYRRCDALIFLSLIEGFGLPILEAQATGRPVVTSNRSAMPEVAGDGALIVDPEDPDAIRAAVSALIQDPVLREGLVERGFANARRFDPRAVAAQYENLYREVAQNWGR